MSKIRGFYGVVDLGPEETDRARDLATALMDGGASMLQVRMKDSTARDFVGVCRLLRRVTRERGVLLIVNDRLDIALAVDADGLHLGQDDLPIAITRRVAHMSGRRLILGVSTHDTPQAVEAAHAGADYVAFGPVFPTTTKKNPDPVQGISGLADACRRIGSVPVVAIGGISLAAVPDVIRAGARAVCVISAVNKAANVTQAAQQVASAFRDAP